MLERPPETLELIKWEPQNHLDIKIQANIIQLDQLIPRITHLALKSSDRKTKVASCELLHSIVLYFIGTNKLSTVIWEKLSPKMIELGCDADAVVQEMFEPLLYQIVHYLSKSDNINLKGTQTFIEALFQQISHPNNNTIQDLSAKLLREFVSWSLRHVPRERRTATPASLVTLFTRLKLYCTSADKNKRKAALLAFNNLYPITRNEKALVSELWIELFYCYCMNYLMTENYYLETQQHPELEQNNVVLDNLVKVFVRHKAIFDTNDRNRKYPAQFGEQPGLKPVALWVVSQCTVVTQRNYRLKCAEMFSLLAKSITTDVSKFVQQEQLNLVRVFEGADGQGLTQYPTFTSFDQFTLKNLQLWLTILLTALDGYHWIIHKKLVASIGNVLQPGSVFSLSVEYFMESIVFEDISNILLPQVVEGSFEVHFMFSQKEAVKSLKQKIVVKVVEILTNVLVQDLPLNFLLSNQKSIIKMIKFMLFEPHRLDFPMHARAEVEVGQKVAAKFLLEVNQGEALPINVKEEIMNEFYEVSSLEFPLNILK